MLKNITIKFIRRLLSVLGYEISIKNNYWFKGGRIKNTYYEQDIEFHELYDLAQEKTNMVESDNPLRRCRHYSLVNVLRNAQLSNGEIVELGCWKGLSTYQIGSYLKSKGYTSTFHVFDSFQGLLEIKEIDTPQDRKIVPELSQKAFACDIEVVKSNLNEFDFIKFYKGWIPDKFYLVKDSKFSFVHIDVDLYQPIKDTIDFFYPRLCKNGIIVFDDYGSTQFPGAQKAIDEFVKKSSNTNIFLALPSGQAILIKTD